MPAKPMLLWATWLLLIALLTACQPINLPPAPVATTAAINGIQL